MPRFLPRRKDKTAEIAKAVAAELNKAGSVGPYSNVGYAQSAAAIPYANTGSQIQIAGEVAAMPRPGGAFGAILGPSAPLIPAPLDPVLDDSGRAVPRKYEYEVATNLNITQTSVPYAVLRALAEQCDIIHRAIEIRISELTKMNWSFSLSPDAIQQIMTEENCSHAKAARIGRDKYGDEIVRLTAFWENPYVASDRSFVEWMTEALWQVFVFDQLCVYPRYSIGAKLDATRGQNVMPSGFDVIDAATIKILLDNRGDIPHPPTPAYQQILWGFPRGEFTASPDGDVDGVYYTDQGRAKQFLTDQLYVSVKNRRTWSPYGFSPVEMSIPAATLYLERQRWMRAEYQEGATPKTWMKTTSQEMDAHKLAAFERILNDRLFGNTAERHRIKMLPEGFDPVAMPSEDEKYRPEYDEFIIKRIASCFGVSPTQLGVMPRSGLGGSGEHKGQQDASDEVSKRPMQQYVVEFVNALCRRFLGADKAITFVLNDDTNETDEESRVNAYKVAIGSGQMTLNDVRGELGLPLYDDPSADEPFIATPQGPVYFRGTLETTASGETTGQVGEPHEQVAQGPQSEEGPSAQSAQGQDAIGEGEGSQDRVKTELAAFAKFVRARVKKGTWRDFEFTSIDPDDAHSLNRDGEAIVKGETYQAPAGVQAAAKRALEWIADGKAGDGFTDVGRKRASDLANGHGLSLETVKRMKAYFDRHQSDKDATGFNSGEDGFPSAGRVAWDAWGGDAGYSWAKRIVAASEKSAGSDNPLAWAEL
jgi:Phage portal protein